MTRDKHRRRRTHDYENYFHAEVGAARYSVTGGVVRPARCFNCNGKRLVRIGVELACRSCGATLEGWT
jgi:hypothetical protein